MTRLLHAIMGLHLLDQPKGQLPIHHLVNDHARSPHVHTVRVRWPPVYLGRDEARGAAHAERHVPRRELCADDLAEILLALLELLDLRAEARTAEERVVLFLLAALICFVAVGHADGLGIVGGRRGDDVVQ